MAYAIASTPQGVRYSSGRVVPQTPRRQTFSTPAVMGATTTARNVSTQNQPSPAPAAPPQSQPQQQTDFSSYQNEQENMLNEQINQSYNPAFSALDRMEQDYKQQFPTAQAEINQSYAAVRPEIEKEQATELGGLATQRQKGRAENESQVAKARRLANELRQSNLTRFGGASSTGEASNELLDRTTSEQFGDINKQFGDYNMNLDKEESQVNNYFTKKLSDLEQEKQLKLRTLQDKFDSEIRNINGKRGELESQKAAKRLGALQELSASVQQMKAQDQQFKQELEIWKQYKDEAVNTARQFNAKSFSVPGFRNVFGSYSVTGQPAGGGGGGALSDMQGIMGNVPEGFELGGYSIGSSGKPSYSFSKADDDEEAF